MQEIGFDHFFRSRQSNIGNFMGFHLILEKGLSTCSSTLVWRIPWTEKPGRLQSMGSQRVRHEWAYTHIYVNPKLLTSLVAQRLKRLPAMWETWVQSLGWDNPLEKEMATHSSILAWRIPWTEEPGGLQSKESDTTERLPFLFYKGTS